MCHFELSTPSAPVETELLIFIGKTIDIVVVVVAVPVVVVVDVVVGVGVGVVVVAVAVVAVAAVAIYKGFFGFGQAKFAYCGLDFYYCTICL